MDRGREREEKEKRERKKERTTDISSEIVTIVKLRDVASHNETVNCIRDIVMLHGVYRKYWTRRICCTQFDATLLFL